jgi:hypothetical protein
MANTLAGRSTKNSTRSNKAGISLQRPSSITAAKTTPTVVNIVLRDEIDAEIYRVLSAKVTRGRKKLLPVAADVRVGKHLMSNRDLRKMLLATTEALENSNVGKTGPITAAHVAVAAQSRDLLDRLAAQ